MNNVDRRLYEYSAFLLATRARLRSRGARLTVPSFAPPLRPRNRGFPPIRVLAITGDLRSRVARGLENRRRARRTSHGSSKFINARDIHRTETQDSLIRRRISARAKFAGGRVGRPRRHYASRCGDARGDAAEAGPLTYLRGSSAGEFDARSTSARHLGPPRPRPRRDSA